MLPGKTEWGEGPWITEPDHVMWMDPTTGYLCTVERHPNFGFLCGYVGIPSGHMLHSVGYSQPIWACDCQPSEGVNTKDFGDRADIFNKGIKGKVFHHCATPERLTSEAHGGLTYSGSGSPGRVGSDDGVWFFGFDCGHAGDLTPGLTKYKGAEFDKGWETYRELNYVKGMVTDLAKELAQWESGWFRVRTGLRAMAEIWVRRLVPYEIRKGWFTY